MSNDSIPASASDAQPVQEGRVLSALERRQQAQLVHRVATEMALRVEPDWDSTPLAPEEQKLSELNKAIHEARVRKTNERWSIFLERLSANGGIVHLTLRQCGFNMHSLRKRRTNHFGFEEAFQEALDAGIDKLEDVAKHRALYGTVRPIFYRGRKVSEVLEVSDDLLKFMLRANRPQKYGNKLELSGHLDFTGIEFSRLTEAELQAIAANNATQELIDRIRNAQSIPSAAAGASDAPKALPAASADSALDDTEDAAPVTPADGADSLGGEPGSS